MRAKFTAFQEEAGPLTDVDTLLQAYIALLQDPLFSTSEAIVVLPAMNAYIYERVMTMKSETSILAQIIFSNGVQILYRGLLKEAPPEDVVPIPEDYIANLQYPHLPALMTTVTNTL